MVVFLMKIQSNSTVLLVFKVLSLHFFQHKAYFAFCIMVVKQQAQFSVVCLEKESEQQMSHQLNQY
jgi:hypothetical protein